MHQVCLVYCEWQAIVADSDANFDWRSLWRSSGITEVTNSVFFLNNSPLRARDVHVITLYFSCHGASTDMQLHLLGFSHGLGLMSDFDLTFQCYHAYISACLIERRWWSQNYVTGFLSSKHKRYKNCQSGHFDFKWPLEAITIDDV